MTTDNNKIEEVTAMQVLRNTGINVLEAAMLAKEALMAAHGSLRLAHECIMLGKKEIERRRKTVSFGRAAEAALEERAERRERTVRDFRYIVSRLMKKVEGLSKKRVRAVRSEECAEWIRQAFDTPSQRRKARAALSGVFSTAVRRGWCAENPVQRVPMPRVVEQRIRILTQNEIERLLDVAKSYCGGICLPAVAIMLYAGVRPSEVARLTWGQVHEEAGVISILPEHSKTGGGRQVTIRPPLETVLAGMRRDHAPSPRQRICPPNWIRHWAALRQAAGWSGKRGESPTAWQPDVLRHTFATHHLATFRNYAELQVEMGHRSIELLRTRYVALPVADTPSPTPHCKI